MAKPGALRAIQQAGGASAFNADERTKAREETPVIIGGVTFKRRRKVWAVSRAMRNMMREQEATLARGNRMRARVAELEVEQIEAATQGEDEREAELEGTIGELVTKADDATEDAELVSYRLLALLLIPQGPYTDPNTGLEQALEGFGDAPADEDPKAHAGPAVEWMAPLLDVEDAAALANELTGSREPDPQQTPSSETGST